MIPFLLPTATWLLLFATGFCALAAFALRDFSWNKIDEVAKRRKAAHRFGDILEQHLEAQLAVEISLCLAFSGLLGVLYFQMDLSAWDSADPATWPGIIGRFLGSSIETPASRDDRLPSVMLIVPSRIAMLYCPFAVPRSASSIPAAAWRQSIPRRVIAEAQYSVAIQRNAGKLTSDS